MTAVVVAGAVAALGVSASFAWADPQAKAGHAGRGTLVSADHLRSMSVGDAKAALDKAGFATDSLEYDVELYRLEYRTVDPHGKHVTASGLLALPDNHSAKLTAVSYAHGTELAKSSAPSTGTDTWDIAPAVTYGSSGFAAVAPDYVGMGTGDGAHPWMDVPSETTASVDMLRAAREYTTHHGRQLRHDVMITGFSQGASAATGLADSLDNGGDDWFTVGALAPISGAYHWSQWLRDATSGGISPKEATVYLAYWLVSWDRTNDIYGDPSEVFAAPYDKTVPPLLDGEHDPQDVVAALPDTPDELLTPHAKDMIAHPTGNLARALEVADGTCSDAASEAPTRLYFASGDAEVPGSNSRYCRSEFAKQGVDVGLNDLGDHAHLETNQIGTAKVVRWFESLS